MEDMEKGEDFDSAFKSPTFGVDGSVEVKEPVGSASISPCGRDIVLASRQGLHIIDLDTPFQPPRHLPHHIPWEVADVQWSPFASRDFWVVSTSNQKALVWNLAMINPRASIEHVLHAHSRAITDINFSAHHPDILATCAVDSYVHCWDLRHPARPIMTFCDWFAGATQVKWNRQDAHILASSHDRFLRIWDNRKGAYPLRSIEAHATKIYGVDWNRTDTKNVATCSLDKTIKFWDYTGDVDEPTWTIHTPFPVWRARHTPFGSGLLAMPQRGDCSLHLYDRRLGEKGPKIRETQPTHRFDGHADKVKEFLWRSRGNISDGSDNREFQLISWGTDGFLRLHRLDENILQTVGFGKGMEATNKVSVTRKNARYQTFHGGIPRQGKGSLKDSLINPSHIDGEAGLHSHTASGMTISRTPISLNGTLGKATSMSSVGGRSGHPRQTVDPILWMRGVKIGKKEVNLSAPTKSSASMLSPTLKTNPIWDTFDSVAEEIIHVGEKFHNVKFDEVDIPMQYAKVSFTGPWGPKSSSVHIRARVDFPLDYPETATPILSMEKPTSMNEEVFRTISSEVQLLTEAYMSEQKNSLEAILRYLLGEANLDDSLTWLKLNLTQDLTYSSSDEDDDVGTFSNMQTLGMDMADSSLGISNEQYNVPVAKTCGALWANDGRLVCFFPIAERSLSVLDLNHRATERSSRSHKTMFEGFGRLHNKSPASRKKISTLQTIESDDSGYDDSLTSSSGSSESSGIIGEPRYHLIPSIARLGNASDTQRAMSAEDSQKSSGVFGFAKPLGSRKVDFISIHDWKDLLPSKQALAKQYLLDDPKCCTLNAKIAANMGMQDLSDAWEFADLILRDEVPLAVRDHPYRGESILIVARRALAPRRRNDSAVDLSHDTPDEEQHRNMKGRIKWASHPFGRRLVKAMFFHFEQLGDIQMLAMLSLVFMEHHSTRSKEWFAKTDDENLETEILPTPIHFPIREREMPGSYFQCEEVASSLLESIKANSHASIKTLKAVGLQNSVSSSIGASDNDPATLFATDGTPPSMSRPIRPLLERNWMQTSSISTSPEHHRHAYRSSSNLASALAASISRPFSFSASASSSPPTTYPKKRISPAGSYLGAPVPGVTWGTTSYFGKSSTITEDPDSSQSAFPSNEENVVSLSKRPVFKITLKNQNQFHNDGYANLPLLDPDQDMLYRGYRQAYAHLLHTWDMPLARCKVLKYGNSAPLRQSLPASTPLDIGRTNITSPPSETKDSELDIRTHCTTCSTILPDHTSVHCPTCTRPQPPLLCLLCACIIRGLSSPCLSCGHVLHSTCRALLLPTLVSHSTSIDDVMTCIAGCGCNCASHAVVQVEYPSRRKSSASLTVTGETQHDSLIWKESTADDEEAWEDVAYESLARNLGAKYLTPRPSQIWRGG